MHRLVFGAAAAIAVLFVGGCGWLGPTAIKNGRGNYNEVIQKTSKEQTLANIVRVYKHEPTLVFDVTEVDATTSFQGSAGGGVGGIGAKPGISGGTLAGQVGSASASLQYSDTPTIRYFPLVGQALVSQLVTPVSVDAIAQLAGSDWPVAPVFDLAVSSLTTNYDDLYVALSTIDELNSYLALQIEAVRSDITIKNIAANDALAIYLSPFGSLGSDEKSLSLERAKRILTLWVRLLRMYADTQRWVAPAKSCAFLGLPTVKPEGPKEFRSYLMALDHLERDIEKKNTSDDLLDVFWCLNWPIELRVAPVKPDVVEKELIGQNGIPVLRTFSALGILKDATESPTQRAEFVKPEEYAEIVKQSWNAKDAGDSRDHYTLSLNFENARSHRPPVNCPAGYGEAILKTPGASYDPAVDVTCWLLDWNAHRDREGGLFLYESPRETDWQRQVFIARNQQLGEYRRYMLIVHGDQLPTSPAPYVSHWDAESGEWFYIDGNDDISKKNFVLISLFMTMMATGSSAPLVPTISVGGH